MARRPKHDPKESEREILAAAEGFLREHPFREMTVEAVMNRTGLKRPAFYAHFRDRHDLALRVVEDLGRELSDMVDRWLNGDDLRNDARAAFEGLAEVYAQHGPVLAALADAAGSDEMVESAYFQMVDRFVDATARYIAEDQARGRIPDHIDVAETARALVWMDERYLTQALGRRPRAEPQRVVDVLYNIWMSTLYGNLLDSEIHSGTKESDSPHRERRGRPRGGVATAAAGN